MYLCKQGKSRACLRWVDEVKVGTILFRLGVFGAVDFSIEQGITHRLEYGYLCLLSLTVHLTLKNVVIFYFLEMDKQK